MVRPRRQADNYIATDVDGEIVLIGLDKGELYAIKDTGRAIWELIDGKRDRAQIVAELKRTYDVDQATLEADLDALLSDLSDAGFLEV